MSADSISLPMGDNIENQLNGVYESIRVYQNNSDPIFEDTPLHRAASSGNTIQVAEIMAVMPSMSKKLNRDGLSPLHVALCNWHLETARRMIKLDKTLIRFAGRGKMTAMHYLVSSPIIEKDRTMEGPSGLLDLLVDFLKECPEAVEDVTIECKTPMHVAIDYKSFDAFEVMFGWLMRTGNMHLLEIEDIYGKSALLLAAQLTNELPQIVNKGEGTRHGLKLISKNRRQIIEDFNKRAKIDQSEFLIRPEKKFHKIIRWFASMHKNMTMNVRNVVLVVAVLAATAVYQATLQPPEGLKNMKTNSHWDFHSLRLVLFLSMNTLAFNFAMAAMLFILPLGWFSLLVHVALYFMYIGFYCNIYDLLQILSKEHKITTKVLMMATIVLFALSYVALNVFAFLKAISWSPWWVWSGKIYRTIQWVLRLLKLETEFQVHRLQNQTVGWSGQPRWMYYHD